MTDVVKNKNRLISSPEDARQLYTATPPEYRGKVGLEVEMPLFRPGACKPEIPKAAEMESLQRELKAKGYDAQLEPAGVLEYASPPVPVAETPRLVAQAKKDIAVFEAAMEDKGYARSPFCVLPTTTPAEALANKVSRERLEASLDCLKTSYPAETSKVPLLTTGVQTSFSPADQDEMFRMAKRAYALTPLLYAAMNSSSGFACNEPARQDQQIRGKYYECYGKSGGIAESFLKSSTSEELIRNHIAAVFETPMFFCYDLDGNLVRPEKGKVFTFRELKDKVLNTQSNYELAETFIYNDVKICNLRDAENNVVGKRIEVRPADSGLHQPYSVLLLTAALIPDGKTADTFDELLKEYGITGNPPKDAPILLAGRKAAVEHNGKFMDVNFGVDPDTGKPRSLREFAADVAGIISAHYANDKEVAPDVAKLCDLLLTGECDAKAHAAKYKSLEDVTAVLQKSQPLAANGNRPQPGRKHVA
ncbi:MAG: hypothetical protein EPN97_12600 [Alphaproteobacteria bacterium]|nr:MAG: hypothetical protein EPN97_12600 [Alphaproteobacteria bacterium]